MTLLDHLFTILIEECAEVQKATTKTLRFGLEEGRDLAAVAYGNNVQRLRAEVNDLLAMLEMLQNEGVDVSADPALILGKIAKVEKYLGYSQECGRLREEPHAR